MLKQEAFAQKKLGTISSVEMVLQITHPLNEQIAQLLKEDNDSRRCVVILGISPGQADQVHTRSQHGLNLIKLSLLKILKVIAQWLQVEIDILGLSESCSP